MAACRESGGWRGAWWGGGKGKSSLDLRQTCYYWGSWLRIRVRRWQYDHGKLSEGVPSAASFAAASARLLLEMLECPGVQHTCIMELERRREAVALRRTRSIGATYE